MTWSPADLGDQSGRRVLVTGATSGIGAATALALAGAGAEVVLAGRHRERLGRTHRWIEERVPEARLGELVVDVADLSAVRRAAARAETLGPLHVLVHNAGLMAPPYSRTRDGVELQLATHHLGPFLLTGLLLPQLVASGDGRVVSVSSLAHRLARSVPSIEVRWSSRWGAYAGSKLAQLLFTYELDRRLRAADLPVRALAAHPGLAATDLAGAGRRAAGEVRRAAILQGALALVAQPAEQGAWPVLMAATADLPGSTYVGPSGPGEASGPPRIVTSSARSHDVDAQRRLWEASERATGIDYP